MGKTQGFFTHSIYRFVLKNTFVAGDKKEYSRIVEPEDAAIFETGMVHPVYATFALARDAEWAGRLFVLEMKDADEEGIGTFITVNHKSPALIGEEITFNVEIKSLQKNEIICHYEAIIGDRIIADGETGQKILIREKLQSIFNNINKKSL